MFKYFMHHYCSWGVGATDNETTGTRVTPPRYNKKARILIWNPLMHPEQWMMAT
jgi:hypothetical protein